MSTKSKFRGFYTLTAVNCDTGAVRVLAEFENLILNGGLNGIGTQNMMGVCFVGSGSTAPIAANTALETLVASTSTIISDVTGADASGYGYLRRTYRFAAGAAAGNLSEIGVGSNAPLLLSRALIKDGDGNPTTITVLSNEFFDVLYEIRLYPPTVDVTFNVTIASVMYACVLRAARAGTIDWVPYGLQAGPATSYNGNLGVVLYEGDIGSTASAPSGANESFTYAETSAYSNNSLTLSMGQSYTLSQGNFSGGIKSIRFGCGLGAFQCSFTPPIPKTSTKTLRLNWAVSWDRE